MGRLGERLDRLIVRTVSDVHKAVKWNQPFYGHEGEGWFLSFRCFTEYVQLQVFRGTSLDPVPGLAPQLGSRVATSASSCSRGMSQTTRCSRGPRTSATVSERSAADAASIQ